MQLDFQAREIAAILGTSNRFDDLYTAISIDSRQIHSDYHTLFFALPGKQTDGHHFIAALYQEGVRGFVVKKGFVTDPYPEANFYEVEDVILALQLVAQHHRNKFDIPVIAITGSYGKTIVKEWLYEVLSTEFDIVRSPKSYNSQIGVPLSLLEISTNAELAIIEAGISQPGEMQVLKDLIRPTYSVLTNIGEAHLQHFRNKQELIKEKLILCKDVESVMPAPYALKNAITFGEDALITWTDGGDHFIFKVQKDSFEIKKFNGIIASNIACILGTLLLLDRDIKKFIPKINQLSGIALRLETIKGKRGNNIILDAYNNDFQGMEMALQHFSNFTSEKRLLVLSDVEDGLDEAQYSALATLLSNYGITDFIGIGEEISKLNLHLDDELNITFYSDIAAVDWNLFEQTTILLRGSRKFHFERCIPTLEYKRHEASIQIDTHALRDNILQIRNGLSSSTKVMVMLKAEAYGSGLKDIAGFLKRQVIDYFGVAFTQEGVTLKMANVEQPVMVMNVSDNDFAEIIEYGLEPSIYSKNQLDRFIKTLIYRGVQNYPIHLNLETGMHRLGIDRDELNSVIDLINSQPEVYLKSVYSHLACADEPDNPYNVEQLNSFEEQLKTIKSKIRTSFDIHILNSSGVLNFPDYQHSMVRLGIGIYGLHDQGFKDVLSFSARISKIKTLQRGETVGYGRNFKAPRRMRIATLPIGYADGVPRKLGNKNWHFSDGQYEYSIVGAVCMDMCMIDISGNPGLMEGDELHFFRTNKDILEMARILKTIPYEIITGFSDRIRRVLVE